MPSQNQSFLDEIVSACRGCLVLLMGGRQLSTYFDFSQRGLAGSFISMLLAVALACITPVLAGATSSPGTISQMVAIMTVFYATQVGATYIALRQMGRQDGFVPYLITSNWMSFIFTVVLSVFSVMSVIFADLATLLLMVLALLGLINICRRVLMLTGWQVCIVLVAQMVGTFVALGIVGSIGASMLQLA